MSDILTDISRASETEEKAILRSLMDLLKTPSVTFSEGTMVPVCVPALEKLGLSVELQHVDVSRAESFFPFLSEEKDLGERPNIIAHLPGTEDKRRLVLNTHLDVIPEVEPSDSTAPPFPAFRRKDRVYGRGAADAKGAIAAILGALAILKQLDVRLACRLEVQLVIGQETGGLGAISAILQNPEPDAVILVKATDLCIARGQTGHIKYLLEVDGKSVMPSVPWEGVNAFDKLIDVYHTLQKLSHDRNLTVRHPLFDRYPDKAPFSVGRVCVGHYPFAIPDWATAEGRFGILPGESPEGAKKAAEDAIRRLGETDPWLSKHPPQITWTHGMFTSWETEADDPVVKALTSASMALAGRAEVIGVTYGSEASHFANLTDASLAVFGPGNVAESHAPNQSVSIKDILEASKILALAALTWDGAV